MRERIIKPPTIHERHQTRRLGVWNGAIWAVGNGLAGTTLITYLAGELNAERFGLGLGLIFAAPHIVGVLRLGAPAMIERLADRKRFCLATFFMSATLLLMLPWLCAPGRLPSPGWSLTALTLLWCFYHLMQYLGTVALWAWLADAAPREIRGRYFGVRQRWMSAGTAAALVGGIYIWPFSECNPACPKWIPYGVAAAAGACCMFAALVPMLRMPRCEINGLNGNCHSERSEESLLYQVPCLLGSAATSKHESTPPTSSWLAPFRDTKFLRFLAYGCWFSLFNGITQAAQANFSMKILDVSLIFVLVMQTGMCAGQSSVSPWLGRLADRLGNRRVMIGSQLLVAVGLLFYAVATPATYWWIAGAWIMWIAYAGLNVCIPNLTLKLAPRELHASYVAAYYAVTGLCFAANSILGGALVDAYKNWTYPLFDVQLAFFPCIFVFGCIFRSLGAAVLLGVVEPKNCETEPRINANERE